MEATMHQPMNKQSAPDNNNTKGGIEDLIKYTPSLEQYVVANILTKCGRPADYEGKYKFILYKEIGIHLPNNSGKRADIIIDFPTKG